MSEPFATLVSVDAWASGDGGWTWNDQRKLAEFSREQVGALLEQSETRKLLAFMRDEGYLSAYSKGRVRVEYTGSDPDFIEIQDRHTGEPLFAFIVRWDD